ncbi:MAG: Arc family DNA-binding protein [Oscillospiraceae bacterium]|nr:Arc family DNA-binding protein [Oscillospiraceae bacterium]
MPNAPHRYPSYALRIPTEAMDKLKYIADRHGRSANKEIERLILRHIAVWEKNHGPILFDDGFVPRSRSGKLSEKNEKN